MYVATLGLYSIYWWLVNWKHLERHRAASLVAFVGCFALGLVPALRWVGWLGILAALAVLLFAQSSVNRRSDLTPTSFSWGDKVILGLAGLVTFFVVVYNVAGPAAK